MSGKGNGHVRFFDELSNADVPVVGGKNASLGEMIRELSPRGIRIPDGFATTANAYRHFLEVNELEPKLRDTLAELDQDLDNLPEVGRKVRRYIYNNDFPGELQEAFVEAYDTLCRRRGADELSVAVRSSATAEDLPEASFAGQQETFLNVTGADELLLAIKRCYASLFTDRAISYRVEKGFDHMKVALSAGVQEMVRADRGGSGVMFTLDTETGFRDVVMINAAFGLGEMVVQGSVNPDEYEVFKPLLDDEELIPILKVQIGDKQRKMVYASGGSAATKVVDTSEKERRSRVLEDGEILTLARWAYAIEDHYGKPMDLEWARDGDSGDLFILQARPETVQSQKTAGQMKTYSLKESGKVLVEGLSVGEAIASGRAQVIESADDMDQFEEGAILVTGQTDPDWVPIMEVASGIVTDYGGRTSHAAIVSRELGIPAVVGTGEATEKLNGGDMVTISCAEGDSGYVYEGDLDFTSEDVNLTDIPDTSTPLMMNLASPESAFRWWRLPAEGVGLARMEFVINNHIEIHPMALVQPDSVEGEDVRRRIEELTAGYEDKRQYFVDRLARGLARIAASQYPHPVVVRMSDFKTNEYADLIGGTAFEPAEENPMLGFRGAARYHSEQYREAFELECRAIRKLRSELGLRNVIVMIPFCRTPDEADRVLEVLGDSGLVRGEEGLEVYVMAEVPSNVLLAEEFAKRFDGFSIGTNDLTQLVLGVDRDSARLSDLFDETDEAVKRAVRQLIDTAHEHGTRVGICGQAPSDHPGFAEFLVEAGIDSISLNPDSVLDVKRRLAKLESQKG